VFISSLRNFCGKRAEVSVPSIALPFGSESRSMASRVLMRWLMRWHLGWAFADLVKGIFLL